MEKVPWTDSSLDEVYPFGTATSCTQVRADLQRLEAKSLVVVVTSSDEATSESLLSVGSFRFPVDSDIVLFYFHNGFCSNFSKNANI